MILPKRLATKLILSLTTLIVLVEGIFALVTIRRQERQLLDEMVLGADQLSRSITSATWQAMLADQRSAAYEVMQTIATKQGIRRIRIFNKEGQITYSTSPNDEVLVDKTAEACYVCHSAVSPLVRVDVPSRARTFRGEDGGRLLGLVTPIYNEPACSQAACHAHPPTRKVLGVLDVALDLEQVDHELASLRAWSALTVGGEILLIALIIILFTRHFVGIPIRVLIKGTKAVSAMQLDTPIRIDSSEDLQEVSESFNIMRERLGQAVAELNELNARLEDRVEERTRQLQVAKEKLIQSDRLASLGRLSATVAHEINNPVAGILNLSMLLERITKDGRIPPGREEDFKRHLSQIVRETTRVGRIVTDLLAFSRRSGVQRGSVDLNAVIRTTLSLLSHKLELLSVRARTELQPDLPHIQGDPSQLQQVIMNLVLNGAESIQAGGEVSISTAASPDPGSIVLEVSDSGSGIHPEHLPRVFEPFFTTKEAGKGVGLGLAVVYGIVQGHGGEITVESEPGRGSRFRVELPIGARAADGSAGPAIAAARKSA